LAWYAPDLRPEIGDGGAGTLELVLQAGLSLTRGLFVSVCQRYLFIFSPNRFFQQFFFREQSCFDAPSQRVHWYVDHFKQSFFILNSIYFGGARRCQWQSRSA
jgi:hypothetical protein